MDDRVDDRKKTIRALKILHIRQSKFQSLYDGNKHRQVSFFKMLFLANLVIYQDFESSRGLICELGLGQVFSRAF